MAEQTPHIPFESSEEYPNSPAHPNLIKESAPVPADLQQEAATEYPYSLNDRGKYIDNEYNHRQTARRAAYISGRSKTIGEYEDNKLLLDACKSANELMGERIKRLEEENKKMLAEMKKHITGTCDCEECGKRWNEFLESLNSTT